MTNSADPDQTHSMASDLGLDCLLRFVSPDIRASTNAVFKKQGKHVCPLCVVHGRYFQVTLPEENLCE